MFDLICDIILSVISS